MAKYYRIRKTHSRTGVYGFLAEYLDDNGSLVWETWKPISGTVHPNLSAAHADITEWDNEPDIIVWIGDKPRVQNS